MLMGHSYLWDAEMWRPQIDVLKNSFRCIVPDLWGHGSSGPLTESTAIADLADDYWQLMQALGIDRFAVVGLSVGGMWGTELALAHPNAVTSLAMLGTYLGPEPAATQQRYLGMLGSIRAGGQIIAAIADVVLPLFFSPATLAGDSPLPARFRRHLIDMPPEQIPSIVALGETIFTRADRLAALAELQMPVFVMVGADDKSRPPAESREMAGIIPDSQLRIILRAGHVANLEEPELISRELYRFLRGEFASRHRGQGSQC